MITTIIIPVFNEAQVISSVIHDLKQFGYKHIIVVDDGSFDRTSHQAKNENVYVLRHEINRGKGAAIKTGIEAAKQLYADVVVTFDGDGQHDPKDIRKLLEKVDEGYDVVLGSRYLTKQHIPLLRRLGNNFANVFTFLLYGIWVTDSQSGLRAYTKKAFDVIDTQNDRYEIESEMLREIKHHHLKYFEIPMHVRYTKYSTSKWNKQNAWNGIKTMFKLLLTS